MPEEIWHWAGEEEFQHCVGVKGGMMDNPPEIIQGSAGKTSRARPATGAYGFGCRNELIALTASYYLFRSRFRGENAPNPSVRGRRSPVDAPV